MSVSETIHIKTSASRSSETIGKLAAALIQFQKRGIKIPKSSKNPFLKSKYADLSTILDHIQGPLADDGLTIVQMPVGEHELCTKLIHESGEYIESTYKMQPLESVIDSATKAKAITPQSIGSVITYQRRYAIGAMLNLNIDDDVDGNPPNAAELAEAASAPPAPKKTAAEIKAEMMAKQAAAANPTAATSNTATQPGKGNSNDSASSNSPTLVVEPAIPDNAKTVEHNTDKCSEADVAEIKKLLGQLEQLQAGTTADFKARLLVSGRKAIADFTVYEAGLLKSAIETKTVAAFFDQSLSKPTP
jgi:hypothetical protein